MARISTDNTAGAGFPLYSHTQTRRVFEVAYPPPW